MVGSPPPILGTLIWILITGLAQRTEQTDPHFCDVTKAEREERTTPCSEFTEMVIQGFSLNKDKSGFKTLTDFEIQKIINDARDNPKKGSKCVFQR
ncbi:hypothetical protein CHS0354_007046 [Potamilus streckersoni]|uniref:Uncharacterized protein n=1 Tax=Potamilus streckersoni TaxID=2493646 RepID=A0AAE0SBR3_9BIVA|nr:hypothetical protein CHS0354_007046 [Potamilus streckersoni]